ncbi:DUF4838 domain-containing protein [Sphingobacterium sp. UGAL515B_05]|uniref:DUF4838 domain-containing protein n=1 Tax=Sphingobacterium sp. UGAL515B_05 TaxID=2986767 RepID=UPI0029541558|nr:DUF4838 domain-containing protein [Sphingobacterium sp. UGAL515B_05]WON93434.1 DUF4838 domain-containing protein [Sphingobacterium sp. UGAL515B_05]
MVTIVQGKERITLVDQGKTDYVIQADANDPVLQKAAAVINTFTKESTGVDFAIQAKGEVTHAIILEKSSITNTFPEDSYSIQAVGKNIYIKGSGKGVLFAAYRYVRDIIGGRKWYVGKENTHVPKLTFLAVDSDLKIYSKPNFQFREVYFPVELDQEYMDWYGLHNLEERWGDWGHTFSKILPPSVYFKEHPEYYSLYDGKRQPIQLCLSNEDVFKLTVAYFKRRISENPTATYWSIAANDDIGSCTCDRCQAIDKREGGAQGSLIHFVNRVAAQFPDKKFTTLAYLESANAPTHLRVADNVSVILSNIDAFRKNDIGSEPSAATFRRQLGAWKAKTKHVFVWDYLTQFTNYLAPFPIQGTMQESLQYLKTQGVEGVFLQGGGATYSDMAELNAYILANLAWDTTLSEEQLTNEFIEGYYGKAAPFIKAYLAERRNHLPGPSSALSIYGNPIDNRHDFLSPEAMDKYSTLLEKAEIASEGNPLLESRVRRIGLGLDYTYLQQARFYGPHQHGIFEQEGERWVVRPKVSRKVTQFVEDAKKLGVIELAEAGASPDSYAKEWSEIFKAGVRANKASEANIKLRYAFDPSFPANGLKTLTDSVPGYMDYSYNWLLWNGEPMDITFDFEQERRIDTITLNFLKDARHWIFPPKEIRISVSKNGKDFQDVFLSKLKSVEEDYTLDKIPYQVLLNDSVKVIRVYASPLVKLPEWRYHPKRKPLIACDEIWLN